ncbi:MAG: site-specific DNA-methyltransferase [Planctomycetota bacterium]|jgi:DNA modification methylase
MSITITQRKVDELIPYVRNSRTHSDEQVAQIAASIKEFGWTNPILVDGEGVIIAGHGRLMAARKLGYSEVPTIELRDLTDAQKKAYVIADNRLALNAGWDNEMLTLELGELAAEGYNLDLLGFDTKELDALLEPQVVDGLVDEDEVPEVGPEPITKPGDVWVLGRHRVMCGDSTSIDAVDKLMPETADMVFTDPPYLMDFTGGIHADGSKSFNAKHGRIANDKMSEQEGDDFLDAINTIIASKVRGAFYITFYRLGIDRYYASMRRTGLQCRSLIIWDKGNHTLSNSDYMSMYEPMFYGWVKDHTFYGGNNGMDIWRVERTKKNELHPTMKPVALVEKAITDASKANDVVLDLFGGSGTTLIAAEKNGRVARLMELDPKYCDVIVKRWEEFTGKKAVLEGADEPADA